MQVTIISIVIGAFGTVTKGLLKGLEDLEVGRRVETIQTTTLLRTARILRRVLEIEETCCHSESSEKPSAYADVKNRETESLLIAAQDNTIRTNHIKARRDKTQQNSKCRLCGDRDETINHIISECSKLAQREYKARHDWVGKVIH